MTFNQTNQIKLHTRPLPGDWTPAEAGEAARAVLLCYQGGRFTCQTFFTQPSIGQLNRVEGLKQDADVYFRDVTRIGMGLFHIRLVGAKTSVRTMCGESGFYMLLRAIDATLTEGVRSRWYLETAGGRERWDAIVSLDRKAFHLANDVNLDGQRTHIHNVIVVGDRLLGRTDGQEVVIAQLTPDLIEREGSLLDVTSMPSLNRIGKIDLLARVPNSDEVFLVGVKNRLYQFDLWGEMMRFEELDERVKQINAVDFNHVRSVLATSEGLFELDIQEMPNMVRAKGLPRQIVHPDLRQSFAVARYVDDPIVLGIHPAMAIMAKTQDDKVILA